MDVNIIENGGWHFSKSENERYIYLLSNYGEHNEFKRAVCP